MTNIDEMRAAYPCVFGGEDVSCGCGNCSAISAWIENIQYAEDACEYAADDAFRERRLAGGAE